MAEQLSQTDALLDKYANMLAKSETVTRLIFDERWGGADAVSIPPDPSNEDQCCINTWHRTTCESVTDLGTIRTR